MTDTYTPKPLAAGVTSQGTFTPDELVIKPGTGRVRTYAQGGGVIQRGTVLGKITATGKLTTSVAAANDGSQVPYAIAAETVDTTAADANGVAYFSGFYAANHLIYGAGHSYATVFDPLRQVDIELHNTLPY